MKRAPRSLHKHRKRPPRTINKNLAGPVDFVHPFTNQASGILDVNDGTLKLPFTPTNSGAMRVAVGATLSTDSKNLANAAGATIGGAGTLDLGGATLTNDGALRPGRIGGLITGTLTILGNLTQGPAGLIDLQLAGNGPGQFDSVDVSGTATLAGTLAVSTAGGYTATEGNIFTVLNAGAVAGSFGTIDKTFANDVSPIYSAANLALQIGSPNGNTWIFDGSDSWDNPARWSQGRVPLDTDQVVIDRSAGVFTITVPAGAFGAERLNSEENITLAGTLGLANASTINGILSINGGTLQGTGPLTVNGDMSLNGGTIASAGGVTVTGITGPIGASQITGRLNVNELQMINGGSLNIATGGVLNLGGGAVKRIGDGTLNMPVVTNSGLITLGGSNLILDGATVNITGTGRFEIQGNVGIQSTGGPLSTSNTWGTARVRRVTGRRGATAWTPISGSRHGRSPRGCKASTRTSRSFLESSSGSVERRASAAYASAKSRVTEAFS